MSNQKSKDYFVCQPAAKEEISSLATIAKEVNLGSTREATVDYYVDMSRHTISGEAPWTEGLLFLMTSRHTPGGDPTIVGNCKLQPGVGGYWTIQRRQRGYREQYKAQHDWLVYRRNDPNSLEFAANALIASERGAGIGRLQTDARVLFLLLYEQELRESFGGLKLLYANLLTTESEGGFAFYEEIVRPFLGNLNYHTADRERYRTRHGSGSPFLDAFLDKQQNDSEVQIPCHLIPKQIKDELGVVRPETINAERLLEKFGFQKADKYDVLDGGQYYETTPERLRMRTRDDLRAYHVKRDDSVLENADADYYNFAPEGRPMKDFICGRSLAVEQDGHLCVPNQIYSSMDMQRNEPVEAFHRPRRKKSKT